MNLNNLKIYKKYDTDKIAESISALHLQLAQLCTNAKIEKLKNINNIVINGMGGSNLGARIIKTALDENLKIPLNIAPGYHVPKYVNNNTLYIISSYSGNTEEPLSAYKQANKQGAKIVAITSNVDNKLKKLIKKNKIPSYLFDPKNNPSKQPRLGIGYSVIGIITILSKIGLLKISQNDIKQAITYIKEKNKILEIKINENKNIAKKLALQLHGKIPILVGAEFLSGNMHILRNQLNECSKLFSSYLLLPELNHYAMEGLVNPTNNPKNLIFLFIDSKLYDPRIQKRSKLTKQAIAKNKIKTIVYELNGKTKLTQSIELLQLSSWLSYYLGILYKVNPAKIPFVDWFKNQI